MTGADDRRRREPVILTVEDALAYAAEQLEARAVVCTILAAVGRASPGLIDTAPAEVREQLVTMRADLREPDLQVKPLQEAARLIRELAEHERIIKARQEFAARQRGGGELWLMAA